MVLFFHRDEKVIKYLSQEADCNDRDMKTASDNLI